MPEDILEGGEAAPSPEPKKKGTIKCEFCECVLLPNGDHTGLSTKAKAMRDADNDLRKKDETIQRLTAENEELKKAAAQKPPEKRKGILGV